MERRPPEEILVPPRFRIVRAPRGGDEGTLCTLVMRPSHAFGDGTHETTRTCLQALAAFCPKGPFRMLDVGSGTGILSIAAAKLGGAAIGVEIDERANEVAALAAHDNEVEGAVSFTSSWPDGVFDVVVANILRDVLLALAPAIVARLAPHGLLVLSGLVSTDVPAVVARYGPSLPRHRLDVFERDVWRTLTYRPIRETDGRSG
jgi:ribosomal protein L11 methyltransferase